MQTKKDEPRILYRVLLGPTVLEELWPPSRERQKTVCSFLQFTFRLHLFLFSFAITIA